jgi:Tol biopolymer transport system component
MVEGPTVGTHENHPTKPCPLCGERIPLGTAKCGQCGGSLVPGRAEKLAKDSINAGRYRISMRLTAACLIGLGILGVVASFTDIEGGLVENLLFSSIFLLLGLGALPLRKWVNYLVLIYFIPATALYAYLTVAYSEPVSFIVTAAGALFTFLGFFNLHTYHLSIIAGVDPLRNPPPKLRFRKIYVLWGVALTLLLGLGLFCWLVVAPLVRVRSVTAVLLERQRVRQRFPVREFVEELGGPEKAAATLHLYARLPDRIAPRRRVAVHIMSACGEHAVPRFFDLIEQSDGKVQKQAIGQLGNVAANNPKVWPRFIELLKDRDSKVREHTVSAIFIHGRNVPGSVAALAQALSDADPKIRFHAAWLLGSWGNSQAEGPLAIALKDKDASVRKAAAEALKKIKQKQPSAVAFPLRREGKSCIHMLFSDGTGLRKLSPGPADYQPILSADGRTVVYTSFGDRTLYARDIRSATRRLLDEVDKSRALGGPQVSDDGKTVVYHRDHGKVFVTRTDGTRPRFVSEMFPRAGYHGVAISGDGRKIAFGTTHLEGDAKPSRPVGELYIMGSDGTNLTRLTANGPRVLDIAPSLSRDGTRITYMSGNYPDWEIWVARTDGTENRNVSRHKSCDSIPRISPDGSRVVFVSDRSGKRQVYVVGFDGKGLAQLTDGDLECINPRFSSDGKAILYRSRQDLCIMNADGSDRNILVRDLFGRRQYLRKAAADALKKIKAAQEKR